MKARGKRKETARQNGMETAKQEQKTEEMRLGAYLIWSLRRGIEMIKHPSRLIPTIVLGIAWIVLSSLGAKMKQLPTILAVMSFLTFAQGGMYGGIIGAVGGILGKAMTAAFLNAMICPIFEKKMPFSGLGGGIIGFFKSVFASSAGGVRTLFNGVGSALLLYGFLNLTQSKENMVVGILAALLFLSEIGKKGGFLIGFLFSAANTFSKGRAPSQDVVMKAISGMSLGMTLAVALNATGHRWCVWMGLLFLAAAFLFGRIGKKKVVKQIAAAMLAGILAGGSIMMMPMVVFAAADPFDYNKYQKTNEYDVVTSTRVFNLDDRKGLLVPTQEGDRNDTTVEYSVYQSRAEHTEQTVLFRQYAAVDIQIPESFYKAFPVGVEYRKDIDIKYYTSDGVLMSDAKEKKETKLSDHDKMHGIEIDYEYINGVETTSSEGRTKVTHILPEVSEDIGRQYLSYHSQKLFANTHYQLWRVSIVSEQEQTIQERVDAYRKKNDETNAKLGKEAYLAEEFTLGDSYAFRTYTIKEEDAFLSGNNKNYAMIKDGKQIGELHKTDSSMTQHIYLFLTTEELPGYYVELAIENSRTFRQAVVSGEEQEPPMDRYAQAYQEALMEIDGVLQDLGRTQIEVTWLTPGGYVPMTTEELEEANWMLSYVLAWLSGDLGELNEHTPEETARMISIAATLIALITANAAGGVMGGAGGALAGQAAAQGFLEGLQYGTAYDTGEQEAYFQRFLHIPEGVTDVKNEQDGTVVFHSNRDYRFYPRTDEQGNTIYESENGTIYTEDQLLEHFEEVRGKEKYFDQIEKEYNDTKASQYKKNQELSDWSKKESERVRQLKEKEKKEQYIRDVAYKHFIMPGEGVSKGVIKGVISEWEKKRDRELKVCASWMAKANGRNHLLLGTEGIEFMADSGIAAGSALLPPPQAKALNAIYSTGKNLATGVGNAMAGNGSLSQNLKKASIDSMIDLGQINASNYVTRGITNIIGEGERTFLKEYVDKGKDFNYDEAIGRALNDAAWKGGSKWFVDESINYATSKMTHPMNLGNELREARSSSYGMMLGMGEEAATMAKYQAYSGVLKQCHEANKVRKVTAVLGETVKKGFTGIES